jgi:hypothetical protein
VSSQLLDKFLTKLGRNMPKNEYYGCFRKFYLCKNWENPRLRVRWTQLFIFTRNFKNFSGFCSTKTSGVISYVSVTQNYAQNSGPKFRLLIPEWIREKFDSDFWSPGKNLFFCFFFFGLVGAWTRDFLGSKSTAEINRPSGQMIWAKKCTQ